jgi:hypothetical protein
LTIVKRRWAAALLGAWLAGVAGCDDGRTALHVIARVASLDYDELRFGVTTIATGPATDGGGPQTLVDPATAGRYVGPFQPGDQDVMIYLPDQTDGAPVRCDVTALRMTAPVAAGSASVTVERHTVKDVEVLMVVPTGAAGTGGHAGASGAAGHGGSGGGGTPVKAPNGSPCSTAGGCANGHCIAGICCESTCDGPCLSCALPATRGLCRAVPQGTFCGFASCADDDNVNTPGVCSSNGACTQQRKVKCPDHTSCTAGICR